ncbi:hypothetical protein VV02_16565 [Luteipulveratus mongoliensis]|uniref:Uncharacterized protein n=1 Tax=Luteipulveratus mongoliensis TaxID=571913 RepID=A0A0K1JK51_9MICO|nr:hypothetical protein VV02_16565 [Luteipulveratus mongoliensis]
MIPTARKVVDDVWIDYPSSGSGVEEFHGVACRRCSSLFVPYASLADAERARAEHAVSCSIAAESAKTKPARPYVYRAIA